MSPRTRFIVLFVSTPLVVLVAVGGLLGAVRQAPQDARRGLGVFDDVVRLIRAAYVEPPNVDSVMDGAMRGLVDGLDPLSAYLTPDEVRNIDSRTPLPTGDVGITVSRQFGYLRVVGLRHESPAAKAGIRSGDFIRAIGDMATRDLSVHAGTWLLLGAPGSKVSLLVFRGNAADPHTFELTREAPPAERATSRKLATGENYVRVWSFAAGAPSALRSAVQSLGASASQGLILDLRDVGNGTPEDGIAAARLFVAQGTLATRTERDRAPIVIAAGPGDGAFTMPVVAIVTRGTAQAAEVFAAALAGNKRAVVVGEPTAALAGVTTLVRLAEGHGLLLTTARYVQNDGKPLHVTRDGGALRPDVAVELPVLTFDQPAPDTDVLTTRAAEELKKLAPATNRPVSPAPQGRQTGAAPGRQGTPR
jgi:carboxyl-terminal processing protease